MIRRFIFFVTAILIAVPVALLSGQEAATSGETKAQAKEIPARYTTASSGKDMYVAYCASCHGKDGKGDGPAASALKSVPGDLTQLAAKKDMPVWGPIFASMGTTSDSLMQLRIRNLTKYIASLQQEAEAFRVAEHLHRAPISPGCTFMSDLASAMHPKRAHQLTPQRTCHGLPGLLTGSLIRRRQCPSLAISSGRFHQPPPRAAKRAAVSA
jgi:mono/diheme cytochrome c family protein